MNRVGDEGVDINNERGCMGRRGRGIDWWMEKNKGKQNRCTRVLETRMLRVIPVMV